MAEADVGAHGFGDSRPLTNRYKEHFLINDGRPQDSRLIEYVETGGLRWGPTFGIGMNATWPFAKLFVASDRLRLSVNVCGIWKESFKFERIEVREIRRTRGLFNVGVIVEHAKTEYPAFILFWTFRYRILRCELQSRGYTVIET